MSTEPLHESLEILAGTYGVRAIVISDEDGLLIGANSDCHDAEPLAALAPFAKAGNVPAAHRECVPTVTRTYSMDDFDILVSAVGEPDACEAAIEAAMPHVAHLVA